MIRSYRDKRTEAFANGEYIKAYQAIKKQDEKRLEILDAADKLSDLAALPSNRFESLTGDRKGQYSISINKQYRICFIWSSDGPEKIEITDYH